ncbi:MAG: carboxypeptidase regulatory-like domain-containing protein [Bryobacterales bacterium]|nr:carboxypeptidase regulatory-like domain-containing protein [Bryobacterales bacterium]
MKLRLWALLVSAALLALAQQSPAPGQKPPPFFKGDKKEKEEATRSVSGTVRGQNDQAVEGAVVQVKDTRTLRVRSYITKADGNYFFHGLGKNVDYELKADFKGASSDKKTLSVYDSRQNAVINLKLEESKKN